MRGTLRLPGNPLARSYDWLRGSPTGLVALALVVGAGGGVGAVAFRYLISSFTLLFSGHPDYSAVGHAAHPLLPSLGMWFVLFAPAVGGLIYGPLVERFAREARGHGVPEVMLAVAQRNGRIRPQVALIKSLASALCIGSGGSVGREGPIVQIGSALGSAIGQALRIPEARLPLMVACGAAAGISATFNAPIAGVIFALELILRDFTAESFGVVVLASVVADVIARAAVGGGAFLTLPPFALTSLWEYGLYAGLGILAAIAGIGFIRVLYGMEDLADRLWRGPEWLRPGVGGIVLGAVLLVLPEMYGVGYPVLERAIRGEYHGGFLALLLVGKVLATSLTIAIGGSGGVFAPSLFMGAMLGTAYGHVLHVLQPGIVGPAGAYGLVGMGALFAATSRAPITAVLIIFELTGEYRIILPLMMAIVLATALANMLTRDTIYTLKLRRRGIEIDHRPAGPMRYMVVKDAMQALPAPVSQDLRLHEVIARFAQQGRDALPVVDGQGRYRGTVTSRRVEQALREDGDASLGDLAESIPTLSPDETLEDAVALLVRSSSAGLPVVDSERQGVVGWLTHHDVLRAYHEWMKRSKAPDRSRRRRVDAGV